MDYTRLNETNKVKEATIQDGYNGATTNISYHKIDGELWIKCYCGCFKAPDSTSPPAAAVKRLKELAGIRTTTLRERLEEYEKAHRALWQECKDDLNAMLDNIED